jgi:malonyl-CoA O-methyltransferase
MLDYKKKLQDDFSKSVQNYNQHASLQQEVAKKLVSSNQEIINNSNNIIDLGCGTGFISDNLAKNINLTQIDIACAMAKYAARNHHPTIVADVENLPFSSNNFDLAISSLAIQWADLEKVLTNITNILTNSGKFLLTTIGSNSFYQLKEIAPNILFEKTLSKKEILTICKKLQLNNVTVNSYEKQQYFPTIKDFFISLKKIGAGYKSGQQVKFLGKKFFNDLAKKYQDYFPQNKYFTISWEILEIKKK